MNTISAPEGDSVISQILAAYALPGTVADVARHGKGHINDTFCVVCRRAVPPALFCSGCLRRRFPTPRK